ncbi:MAG TPA: aminotransferase class I/II-fold pyridoxal phosphate-dependent enzyme [Acidimicrobiales bacterium]
MVSVGHAPPPSAHGGDGARLAQSLGIPVDDVLDLSASLNPVAPDVRRLLARHLESLSRYPDVTDATNALANAMGVDPGRLVLTNGGAEAIALVAAELQSGWIEDPEFSLYRRHLLHVEPNAPRWRSNPNNPSGLLAGWDETAEVWDEAFWQLATGSWTRGDADNGSIVIGSLTKLLACPGLRIGYVICPSEEVAGKIRSRQPQWPLNGLAASGLPELLETIDLRGWARSVAQLRGDLERLLRDTGFDPRPSDANWLLLEAPGLRDELAQRAILIRDCSSFGMPGVVRIAVPPEGGLERLEVALAHRRPSGRPTGRPNRCPNRSDGTPA